MASTPDGLRLLVLFSAVIKKTFADISQDKKVSPKFVTSVIFFKSNKSRQMLLLKNYVTTSVKLNNMAFFKAGTEHMLEPELVETVFELRLLLGTTFYVNQIMNSSLEFCKWRLK